jgi:hypothetical protein
MRRVSDRCFQDDSSSNLMIKNPPSMSKVDDFGDHGDRYMSYYYVEMQPEG